MDSDCLETKQLSKLSANYDVEKITVFKLKITHRNRLCSVLTKFNHKPEQNKI